MALSEYPVNARDVKFAHLEWLKIQDVLGVDEEIYKMLLDNGVKFAKTELHPINVNLDREGCRLEGNKVKTPKGLKEAYSKFVADGYLGMNHPEEFGGQELPFSMTIGVDEIHVGASPAFHNTIGLSRAAANMVLEIGSDEQKKKYVAKLVSGEWQGTMCLTEAGAGSDVGASLTKATPVDETRGLYKIQGTKVFITSGDHDLTDNHIHAVLARIEGDPDGVKGLSLFLIPKFRVDEAGSIGEFNDVNCTKIEEKMGIHGSPTCVLNFGDNNNCIGELIGGRGRGIQSMFHIMNEERMAVGVQGMAVGNVASLYAQDYAHDRIQGSDIGAGKSMSGQKVAIVEHPDVRRMIMTMKGYIEGSRALLYRTALEIDLSKFADSDADKAKHESNIGFLTPLCKAYCSDIGFEVSSIALQVYGGYGYISEYPVEQYLRDSRITSVYEGTNGIQAIDLLFRKIAGSQGQILMQWGEEIQGFISEHKEHPLLSKEVAKLEAGLGKYSAVSQTVLMGLLGGKYREVALTASPYLRATSNLVCGYLLMQQAVVAAEKVASLPADPMERRAAATNDSDLAFYDSKVQTAKFFVNQILSQNRWLLEQCSVEETSALAAVL
ncbi:MAG: acyl-CoA dehydrogenase [Planctomycetes bacterium]|nr:acyl-CoA dehydrogenase [Planctomycetota bacterium]